MDGGSLCVVAGKRRQPPVEDRTMYEQLAIIAAFVFAFSLIAGRVDRLPLSGPMIYVAFGLVMGPAVLGTFTLSFDTEALRTLAELTLAFVLFTGAANAD